MNRQGKVIKIDKNKALVKLMKHSACGDCGACHLGEENMDITIEAINDLGANIGDKVEVNMAAPNVLRAAFIGYGIPLISLILGILLGKIFLDTIGFGGNIELFSFLIGIIFLAITYLVIRINEDNFKKSEKYVSKIINIIS